MVERPYQGVLEGPELCRERRQRMQQVDARRFVSWIVKKPNECTGRNVLTDEPGRQQRDAQAVDCGEAKRFEIVATEKDFVIGIESLLRGVENAIPSDHVAPGAIVFVQQPMSSEVLQGGRFAKLGDIVRTGADEAALGGQLDRDQRAILLFSDADGSIQAFRRRVRQPFRQVEFDLQFRIAAEQFGQHRDDKAFAECRQTTDPQHTLRRVVQRGDFGPGIGDLIQNSRGSAEENFPGFGESERAGRTDEQAGANAGFQSVDLPHDRGDSHPLLPAGGRKAFGPDDIDECREVFSVGCRVHLGILRKNDFRHKCLIF